MPPRWGAPTCEADSLATPLGVRPLLECASACDETPTAPSKPLHAVAPLLECASACDETPTAPSKPLHAVAPLLECASACDETRFTVSWLAVGLLNGKRIAVTGVLTNTSLAYGVAETALAEGAEVVLTGAGRGLRLTQRTARRLGSSVDVIEFDVTDAGHCDSLREELGRRWSRVDGALHSIGYAPAVCLGGTFMEARWDDVRAALEISTYSLKMLADAVVPLMSEGGSIVGLDFDASVAWPAYDWMGVAKAGLEATCRYLARYLGPQNIRVNLVAAGPVRTMAAKSIPGFEDFEEAWARRAPLSWDVKDSSAVARTAVALLSDWLPATTGSIVHADGGFHAIGA